MHSSEAKTEARLVRSAAPRRADVVAFRKALDETRAAGAAVLLVMPDGELRGALQEALKRAGYGVAAAAHARAAGRLLSARALEVAVVDVSSHDEEVELCRALTATAHPVITITAPGDELERIVSLEMGADDSVSKPVSGRELLARVRAVLRRRATPPSGDVLEFSGWRLDTRRREVRAPDGSMVVFTQAIYALLEALAAHPEEVLCRERLARLVGEEGAPPRMIDWRMTRLRARLDRHPGGGGLIRSIHGRGYYFDSPVRRRP